MKTWWQQQRTAWGWRLKWGWECVGGHAADAQGRYATGVAAIFYRYVWYHRRTHTVRMEDRPWK
jgi:sterol desaturase/sphingolipid hydroxylase (fatty acid hydroxylase superfamily)